MFNSLGLLLGSGTDSYSDARKRRKDELAQEWLRQLQEKQQILAEAGNTRSQERHDYDKMHLWDKESDYARLRNEGLEAEQEYRLKADPLRVKGLELQNLTSEYDLNELLPLKKAGMQTDNAANEYKLNYMLPKQEEGLRLGNELTQKNINWYDPTKKAELENMYSLMEARGKETSKSGSTGINIPKNRQEQAIMLTILRQMAEKSNTAGDFLRSLEEYAPELQLSLGEELYQQLYGEIASKAGGRPELYFGRNPIVGDLVGNYLLELGLIEQLRDTTKKSTPPKKGLLNKLKWW